MKIVELASLGRTVTGKTPSSANPEDFGDQYSFVTPTDSIEFKFVDRTERSLSEPGVKRLKDKLLPSKSVLVSCIGSAMGKVVMNSRPCVTNQQFNSLVVDQTQNSPDYVYYALKNNYKLLRNAATGSTALPLLNKTDFDRLKLRIHSSKAEQLQIAGVLSALDSKIELNNRINAELEGMAKLLYDYWFVQFDFPMTAAQAAALGNPKLEGKAYRTSGGKMIYNETLKREIPEGWKSRNILAVSDIGGGATPSKKAPEFWGGDVPFFTPTDAKSEPFCIDTEDHLSHFGLKNKATRLYPKGTLFITARGSVGKAMIISREMAMNQSCYALCPHEGVGSAFLYFHALSLMNHLRAKSSGSVFDSIVTNDLNFTPAVVPDRAQLEAFNKIAEPMFKTILNHQQQNQELTKLRDWLFPMLMNGQVTVN